VEIAALKLLEKPTVELAIRKVTRSAGIGSAKRSSLEFGVPMYMDSVDWDARTTWRDGLTMVADVMSTLRWLDVEYDVREKTAEGMMSDSQGAFLSRREAARLQTVSTSSKEWCRRAV
jgi:hypothetical protein